MKSQTEERIRSAISVLRKMPSPRSALKVSDQCLPFSWNGDGSLIDYGRSFVREIDISIAQYAHKYRISALRRSFVR